MPILPRKGEEAVKMKCKHVWKMKDNVEKCTKCGATSTYPPTRAIKSIIFYGVMYPMIHEMGHIIVGMSQGRILTEAVFFSLEKTYVVLSPATLTPTLDIVKSLAGIAMLPLYLSAHRGALGKFMKNEVLIIIAMSLMGASGDFTKILRVLGVIA